MDVEAQQSWNCRKAWDYSLRPAQSQGPPSLPTDTSSPRTPDIASPPALVVIDTQSLFDWLVFRNPICSGWPAALASNAWEWIFTSPMKEEFDHVAAKGFGERWPMPFEAAAEAWARHGRAVPIPQPPGAAERLPCSDPDDQKFIDLAIAARAHTLVSRDKALLKLARRAQARHGLRICTPAAWSAVLPAVDAMS